LSDDEYDTGWVATQIDGWRSAMLPEEVRLKRLDDTLDRISELVKRFNSGLSTER
jgi:hypothetical protein